MKVYAFDADDGDAPVSYATKREAVAEARKLAEWCRRENLARTLKVEMHKLAKIDKALIVRLINHEGGYVDEMQTVLTIDIKKRQEPT